MSRYKINEVETDEGDQIFDGGSRRPDKWDVDQPKRSPIRRKDKMKPEEGMKPKAKRDNRKIQHRIKYELYEATNQVGKNEPLNGPTRSPKKDIGVESAGKLTTVKPEKQNQRFRTN